jgi:hypothetical protein
VKPSDRDALNMQAAFSPDGRSIILSVYGKLYLWNQLSTPPGIAAFGSSKHGAA